MLTQCEIWLRHVKSALRRVSVRDCKAMGTGSRPLLFVRKVYKVRSRGRHRRPA
nr:MAG TPA: hypothetical protein [Caudoviricetes sp.]